MADDGDEVKVFRRHEEDESDVPSLADDKKDVAMEEEMESTPFIGGKGAFQPTMASSPAFPPLFPMSPGFGNYGMMPFLFNPAMAAAAAYTSALQLSLSPRFGPPMGTIGSPTPLDMYSRIMAAASPLAGPKANLMANVPLPASIRPNPLNQIQMMGGMPGFSMNPSSHNQSGGGGNHHQNTPSMKRKREKEEHIKKPMNAFMWFMKENRPKLMEEPEFKEKQSAELNKELGARWQVLAKDEQQKYYELAAKDKDDHNKKYPNWSARENYACNKKKKKKRDRTVENGDSKKCRARFGMGAQDKWCKHCMRKKKCLYTGGSNEDDNERASSHSAQQRASDSESDLEDDPSSMSIRELIDMANDTDRIKMELQ